MSQTKTITLELHECPVCGVPYGLTDGYEERRRHDHKTFYCPNGHTLSYDRENREEKLKRQLEQTSSQLARTQSSLETSRRSKAAIKGQLTKTKRRVANGVCPCCNRTFADLAAHMHGQHPEYGEASS
jgi:hypothetical protein